MFIDKRRADREAVELPAKLLLCAAEGDAAVLCGPLAAQVVDLSRYGARLMLEQVRVDELHLFYTPRDDRSCALFFELERSDSEEPLRIPVWPVWFNRLLTEEGNFFQLGVEFMLPPGDLLLKELLGMARERSGGGGWKEKLKSCLSV